MPRRPQFTLRALLMSMLVMAAFFGSVQFEKEWRKRADDSQYELDLTGGPSNFSSFEGPLRPEEQRALVATPEQD